MLHNHIKSLREISFLFFAVLLMQVAPRSLRAEAVDVEFRTPVCAKYVQGGLTDPGNGSKESPYNSLARAQADTAWTVLIVLPSTTPLDGGITMRPGTALVGTRNPFPCGVGELATITNSSLAQNGGNGVVVASGNVQIKNINFIATVASAINYDNAKNIIVENVVISGANQGGITALLPDPHDPAGTNGSYYVGGIQATAVRSGSTILRNVVVKDNVAGQGVAESIKNGICRQFEATCCEFVGLGQIILPTTLARVDGILLMAYGIGTHHSASISCSYFHDYNPDTLLARHIGFEARPSGGAHGNYEFTKNRVANLIVNPAINFIRGDGVTVVANDVNPFIPAVPTEFALQVRDSEFTESFANQSNTVILQQKSSVAKVVLSENVIQGYENAFATFTGGPGGVNTIFIQGNNVSTFGGFVGLVAFGGFLLAPRQKVIIKNNNFVGESGIGVQPNFEPNSSWAELVVTIENNCLTALPLPDTTAFAGFGTANAGKATMNIHNNNVVGFTFDILDQGASVNYFAQRNWWDGVPSVVNNGTGVVDVSNPLTSPIVCPVP